MPDRDRQSDLADGSSTHRKGSEPTVDKLWQVLARAAETPDAPLTCDDCVVVLDTLADLLADGLPPREVLAVAEKYLQRCPDCHEYQQALAEFALLRR